MIFENEKELPDLVKQYLCYITTIKNRSVRTAQAYSMDLCNFFKFYKLHKGIVRKNVGFSRVKVSDVDIDLIRKVTLLDVYEYLNFVMTKRGNSARARARKVSSIRGFFKYLTHNLKLLKENPVENLELPAIKKTLPKFLSVDESKELLETTSKSEASTKYRDYCILTLFLNCGMRVSELHNISIKDYKLKEGNLKLLGKGNKERLVYINNACVDAMKNYVEKERNKLRKIVDKDALFLASKTGKRLGVRQIQKIVENALNEAGFFGMGYSPHKLRHTAATLLYQHGKVDILVLKELLGHENVGTTEIYTHVSNKMLRNAVFKNPLADETMKH